MFCLYFKALAITFFLTLTESMLGLIVTNHVGSFGRFLTISLKKRKEKKISVLYPKAPRRTVALREEKEIERDCARVW